VHAGDAAAERRRIFLRDGFLKGIASLLEMDGPGYGKAYLRG